MANVEKLCKKMRKIWCENMWKSLTCLDYGVENMSFARGFTKVFHVKIHTKFGSNFPCYIRSFPRFPQPLLLQLLII